MVKSLTNQSPKDYTTSTNAKVIANQSQPPTDYSINNDIKITLSNSAVVVSSRDSISFINDDKGEISDGYHTFNELYDHRAKLFSVICNMNPLIAWKSKKHSDGSMYDGMFIVGINTPEGPATYHYYIDKYWDLFKVKELDYAPEWDGHTSEDAINRILSLSSCTDF